MEAAPVLCFGEMLWDELPTGRRPGGAPMNVAYHLTRLGCPALPVSAVGTDGEGRGLLEFLATQGLSTDGVARHAHRPTGVVRATLDPSGNARYTIETNTAWDEISADAKVLALASRTPALVFGSLAQRSSFNRATLANIQSALPASALRVFDVNLRPPHDDLEQVLALARGATVVKLNHEEAARISGRNPDDLETNARTLAQLMKVDTLCITAGSAGAGLLRADEWTREPGRSVQVADTVGAGDAFLAALVHGLLGGGTSSGVLARACRLGEFVACREGATPPYDPKDLAGFSKDQ